MVKLIFKAYRKTKIDFEKKHVKNIKIFLKKKKQKVVEYGRKYYKTHKR